MNTIHVSQLAELELRARELATDCESFVDGWEDCDGVVFVNGEPARGGYRVNGIEARHSYLAPCHRCGGLKIERPLRIAVRFERALDRLMFYHVNTEAYGHERRHCDACTEHLKQQAAGL